MSLPSFFSSLDDDSKDFASSRFEIQRCFDSHVHWQGSGEFLTRGRLESLHAVADWKQVSPAIRGDWRLYFGWNPTANPGMKNLTAETLEQQLPSSFPILVSHSSGHQCVVNRAALAQLGWRSQSDLPENLRPFAESDSVSTLLTGCFSEAAHFEVLRRLPALTDGEFQQHLILGQDYFLAQGFTHIREMMAHPSLVETLAVMESAGSLRCYVDVNLHLADLSDLTEYLQFIQDFRHRKPLPHVRLQGLKVFLDGSLGAGTAALSTSPRPSVTNSTADSSKLLWSQPDFAQICDRAFSQDTPLSVHCIGDRATEMAILIAEKSAATIGRGQLNIEHGEVFDPKILRQVRHVDVIFHFQPSHILSDLPKLKDLFDSHPESIFPWRSVEDGGFDFFFGSDSPVGKADLRLTRQGLRLGRSEGIRPLRRAWWRHHQHPDVQFGAGTRSVFNSAGEAIAVFDGSQVLFASPDATV